MSQLEKVVIFFGVWLLSLGRLKCLGLGRLMLFLVGERCLPKMLLHKNKFFFLKNSFFTKGFSCHYFGGTCCLEYLMVGGELSCVASSILQFVCLPATPQRNQIKSP